MDRGLNNKVECYKQGTGPAIIPPCSPCSLEERVALSGRFVFDSRTPTCDESSISNVELVSVTNFITPLAVFVK